MPAPSAPAEPQSEAPRQFGEARFYAEGEVSALAYGADGSLWTVDEGGVLQRWTADGRPVARHFLSDLETLWAFGPGAKTLVSGNDDLLLWDAAEGSLLGRLEGFEWVTAVAFAPDGRSFASGHDDGQVRVWDWGAQRLVGRIPAHVGPVSALAFSPDGSQLATAGEDRAVRVWDAHTHARTAEFAEHTDRIPALAWAPGGDYLVSGSWDATVRVWTLGQVEPQILLNDHGDQVLALAFAPKTGRLAVADSDESVSLWADPRGAVKLHALADHIGTAAVLAFSPDGSRLATAGSAGVIHVWDAEKGERLHGPDPASRHPVACGHGAGRSWLASVCHRTLRLYDLPNGQPLTPAAGLPAASLAADPSGRFLAVGGTDHRVRLWRTDDLRSKPRTLEATKSPVGALAFSRDGAMLAMASPADGLVWLWDTSKGEPSLILIDAADNCTLEGVAVAPDGSRVAVGGVDYLSTGERDGAVVVWEVASKERSRHYDYGVTALAFDGTGRYLAGAGLEGAVLVWDTESDADEPLLELRGLDDDDEMHAVAFSPDGGHLLAGNGRSLRVWEFPAGDLVAGREFASPVRSVAFCPGGANLFVGHANATCTRLEWAALLAEE